MPKINSRCYAKNSIHKKITKLMLLTMLLFAMLSVYDIKAEEKESDDNEIVFVKRRCGGWISDNGYFIDKQGDVYQFDFSELDAEIYAYTYPEGEEFMGLLDEVHRVTLPSCTIDLELILWCDMMANNIDTNVDMESEHVGYDCGSDTLYYVADGELIEVYSDGDYVSVLSDIYAKYVRHIFTNHIEPLIEQ